MLGIKNLVFEGGGVWGVAYLGVLDYLYHKEGMKDITRIAGTSAGAITACIAGFNLPFEKVSKIANSLDYGKIPSKGEMDFSKDIPPEMRAWMDELFGDVNCTYRLLHNYGWYSTEYFYDWIRGVIAEQFDAGKKEPPYTFADFKNPQLHKDNRPFLDLYIVGTNLSMKASEVFSFETAPDMEVAEAVRISMSIPLVFEAVVKSDVARYKTDIPQVYCDGGAMNNYPLNIFDTIQFNTSPIYGVNMETLGVRFLNDLKYTSINNLLEYIGILLDLSSYIQQEIYERNPLNKARSIVIDPGHVNPIDFSIKPGNANYQFLYSQGYYAAKAFWESR